MLTYRRFTLLWFLGVVALVAALLPIEAAKAHTSAAHGAPVHEEMALEARNPYLGLDADPLSDAGAHLTGFESEVWKNFASFQAGTRHEDEFDHVYDFHEKIDLGRVGLDEYNGATVTHFWNADAGPLAPFRSVGINFPNSWQKVQALWAMALGEYDKNTGDGTAEAFELLGHIAHLIGDQTVPAHAHEDPHALPFDDDAYEDWMQKVNENGVGDRRNYELTSEEQQWLQQKGPVAVPAKQPAAGTTSIGEPWDLYWLFYTTNQVGDFFASDDANGDNSDPLGWASPIFDEMCPVPLEAMTCAWENYKPTLASDLANNDYQFWTQGNDDVDTDEDGDLSRIRDNAYLHGIRAMAGLLDLFDRTVSDQALTTVTIERVTKQGNRWQDPFNGKPDYYARVSISGVASQNAGDRIRNSKDIFPDWRFVHSSEVLPSELNINLQLWEWDAFDDDHIDIRGGTGRSLVLDVDMDRCLSGLPGAITPPPGVVLLDSNGRALDSPSCGESIRTLETDNSVQKRSMVQFTVTAGEARHPTTCEGVPATIVGTQDDDVIWGTEGDDVIRGTPGSDVINSLGGHDTICALQGDDIIDSGDGFDKVFAGIGDDTINGGDGNDKLVGGAGNDTILGGNGNDRIQGGEGADVLHGENGRDRIAGAGGNDLLRGGKFADLLLGGLGRDELFGDEGNDVLKGGAWIDTMDGGPQTDGCTLTDPSGNTEVRFSCETGVFGL